jgi:uncharacterized protein DUF6352
MKDFWLASGHHLLDRGDDGFLVVTDEFLKVYLARPELQPPPEACTVERDLHAALFAAPRRPVEPGMIDAIADADARENWRLMVAFRDGLLRHRTIEAAYLALIRDGVGTTPPLFLDQLVHVILRNALDGCEDAFVLRAGELFFRRQRLATHQGALLAADEEMIANIGSVPRSPLMSMLEASAASAVEVLTEENAPQYWQRSDRFDLALDLTADRRGLAALAAVIERWLQHMLRIEVRVEPLREIRDMPFTWYIGLDAEGTRIGDGLWRGEAMDEPTRNRLIALFALQRHAFAATNKTPTPIYLILAMAEDKLLRVKPQNLLVGLPASQAEAVA